MLTSLPILTETRKVVNIPVTLLSKTIQSRCNLSNQFACFLRDSILATNSRALRLIIYHDGVTPGNVLRPNNQLKSVLVYATFAEFGQAAMGMERVWFTLAVIREGELDKLEAGMSTFMKHFVKHLAGEVSGGISFQADSKPWLLNIAGYSLLSDEAALKQTFQSKGASGLNCCLKCQNVLTLDDNTGGRFVHISEADSSKFIPSTDQDCFLIVDQLSSMKEAGVKPSVVDEFQIVGGFVYFKSGLLQDAVARVLLPPSAANYDPMRVYFSKGIFGFETKLLFRFLDSRWEAGEISVSSDDFLEFAHSRWRCDPLRGMNAHARKVMAKLAFKDKAPASGLLFLFPLLDYFARSVLLEYERTRDKIESYISLCDVLRATQQWKKGDLHRSNLLSLQSKGLDLFVRAWGKDAVRPKHHFAFHISEQVEQIGVYLDCFCCERKHRAFKKIAVVNPRLDGFGKGVLAKLLTHEQELLRLRTFASGLHKDGSYKEDGMTVVKGSCLLLPELQFAFVVEGFEPQGCYVELVGKRWAFAAQLHLINQMF